MRDPTEIRETSAFGIRRETAGACERAPCPAASARRETVVASGGSGRHFECLGATSAGRLPAMQRPVPTSKLSFPSLKCNDTDEAMKRVPRRRRRDDSEKRRTVKTRRRDTLRKSATGVAPYARPTRNSARDATKRHDQCLQLRLRFSAYARQRRGLRVDCASTAAMHGI